MPNKDIPFRPMFKLQVNYCYLSKSRVECARPGCAHFSWMAVSLFFQFFRTSQPAPANATAEDAAADEAEMTEAFAATGASAGQQSIWRQNYRWLRGLPALPEITTETTTGELLATLTTELTTGETEPVRVGAAYQLAELARGANDDSDVVAVRVLCDALSSGMIQRNLRGIHGSAEHLMRAASYGLGAAGPTAVSSLLSMLAQTDWTNGSQAACARRILHALGDATERPSAEEVAAVEAAYDQCCAELIRYTGTLTDWPLETWDDASKAVGTTLHLTSSSDGRI